MENPPRVTFLVALGGYCLVVNQSNVTVVLTVSVIVP